MSINKQSFLRKHLLSNGHEKFLALAAFIAGGDTNTPVSNAEIRRQWPKSVFGVKYNPIFYSRAQASGLVDPNPSKAGEFHVTSSGLTHLASIEEASTDGAFGAAKKAGNLLIVNRKGAHTFDKYLRGLFANAKSQVLIADSYVDEKIFDTVLDSIPTPVPTKLLYGKATGNFDARAARFATEFPRFASKRYSHLHDRFVVVDKLGYVLGPSIKDATSNSPAIVVELGPKERHLLALFFDELWSTP
jgi:hypothetical protein